MYPPRWGPTFWAFLHAVVACHEDANGQRSYWTDELWDVIESCIRVIPCPQCLWEASRYMCTYGRGGPQYDDTITPVDWVRLLHNFVNKKLNKPEFSESASKAEVLRILTTPWTQYSDKGAITKRTKLPLRTHTIAITSAVAVVGVALALVFFIPTRHAATNDHDMPNASTLMDTETRFIWRV